MGSSPAAPTAPSPDWSSPFWSLVDRSGGPEACWPYRGYCDADGYARWRSGKRVSRLVCEETNGPPPFPRAVAMHSCDNPPCCNGRHLSWGTQRQNVMDARAIRHIRDCAECREDRGGCDEGKGLAHYAYSLSPGAARMAAKKLEAA